MKTYLYTLLLFALMGLSGCRPAGSPAARYAVRGLDISHYQGVIDWTTLDAAAYDFIFIKASEGASLQDSLFAYNWSAARARGLRRGAYHFFRPEVSPSVQAANFFNRVDLLPGDLPPVLDVEDRGNLSPEELVAAVTDLGNILRDRYGVWPILYTGQHFYNRFFAGHFTHYPLWLARYDTREPVTVCGRDYQFWQYSCRGKVAGIAGPVDENIFTGRLLDLSLLCLSGPALPGQDIAGTPAPPLPSGADGSR